jgi:hypothetical protein
MSENRFAPFRAFDFTKWHRNWRNFAKQSTSVDGEESVNISKYLFEEIGIDRRNIATGGASDYEFVIHYPRPNLADSYGQSQWMPILMIQMLMDISPKKNVLALSGGLDRFRLEPFQNIYGSKITFLNNKKLSLYEMFQSANTPLDYEVVTVQELRGNEHIKFDMIIGWSQDMEDAFNGTDFWVDRLNDGGFMVIQNSSDSVFLYQNDTIATPVWSYHEELMARDDCRTYHIPLFYGVTVVVKGERNVGL